MIFEVNYNLKCLSRQPSNKGKAAERSCQRAQRATEGVSGASSQSLYEVALLQSFYSNERYGSTGI